MKYSQPKICRNYYLSIFDHRLKCIKKADLARIKEFEIHNYYADFLLFTDDQEKLLQETRELIMSVSQQAFNCL